MEEACELPEEGCKLTIFEPSAPPELELEPKDDDSHKKESDDKDNDRALTDFRLKYHLASVAKKNEKSTTLQPLLQHFFFNSHHDCDCCRLPFNSQRYQVHRI